MAASRRPEGPGPRTLAIDIGGSGIKALILDPRGRPVSERSRVETPRPATPAAILSAIMTLARDQGRFGRIAVGFPGVVVDGVVHTAVNLEPEAWRGIDLRARLSKRAGCPVRVCNDADLQGLGVVAGKGVELVLTLGTGIGSGLFLEGRLVPNLELGHHPFEEGETYEERLGQAELERVGKRKWRKRIRRAVEVLDRVFNYRILYLGGGNSRLLEKKDLPENVRLVPNVAGLLGGIRLWQDGDSGLSVAAPGGKLAFRARRA